MDQDQLPNDIEALQKRLLSTESKVATYQERNQELERQITVFVPRSTQALKRDGRRTFIPGMAASARA